MYDAHRHRIYANPKYFEGHNLDAWWRAAHEASHAHQTTRRWQVVRIAKWSTEGSMLMSAIIVILANQHDLLLVASFSMIWFIGSVTVWGSCHVWLEVDACLWAPVLLHEYLKTHQSDEGFSTWVLRGAIIHTRYHSWRYALYGIYVGAAYVAALALVTHLFHS